MSRQRLNSAPPIVIVGVGHMGGAFARGLVAAGHGSRLILIDPALKSTAASTFRKSGALIASDAGALGKLKPEAIILAVKPQLMSQIAPSFADAAKSATVISVAAGTTIESLKLWLNAPRGLIRAMPNLPASIGQGITAAFACSTASLAQRKLAERLLKSVGSLIWLNDESQLNVATAVSGSGPAYIFLLAESLTTAAEGAGLSPPIAKILARKTIEGAAALLASTPAEAADLRKSVTSPGGTTEAALKVLMASARFEHLITEAVEAATARAIELSKSR